MCAMTVPKHLNNMKYNTVPRRGIGEQNEYRLKVPIYPTLCFKTKDER
jgi:hypothetical protein